MTRLLIDTSVLIKWFHTKGESELKQARAVRAAHVSGELQAHMLDLAQTHALSFYDASWAATALELGIPLISADRRLIAAGLAESPSAITARLKLSLN